jgi:hypothetical protein
VKSKKSFPFCIMYRASTSPNSSMSDIARFVATHPPPLKVGGRRQSFSSKQHRTHHVPQAPAADPDDSEPADYPRPAPPSPDLQADSGSSKHVPPPYQGAHHKDSDRFAQRKAETLRDTHGAKGANGYALKGFGAAGRIAQPMKELRI